MSSEMPVQELFEAFLKQCEDEIAVFRELARIVGKDASPPKLRCARRTRTKTARARSSKLNDMEVGGQTKSIFCKK